MTAIERRLRAIETRTKGTARQIILAVRGVEDGQAAKAMHLATHPQDVGAFFLIVATGIERHAA